MSNSVLIARGEVEPERLQLDAIEQALRSHTTKDLSTEHQPTAEFVAIDNTALTYADSSSPSNTLTGTSINNVFSHRYDVILTLTISGTVCYVPAIIQIRQ